MGVFVGLDTLLGDPGAVFVVVLLDEVLGKDADEDLSIKAADAAPRIFAALGLHGLLEFFTRGFADLFQAAEEGAEHNPKDGPGAVRFLVFGLFTTRLGQGLCIRASIRCVRAGRSPRALLRV
jgi:hypothetical protein